MQVIETLFSGEKEILDDIIVLLFHRVQSGPLGTDTPRLMVTTLDSDFTDFNIYRAAGISMYLNNIPIGIAIILSVMQ